MREAPSPGPHDQDHLSCAQAGSSSQTLCPSNPLAFIPFCFALSSAPTARRANLSMKRFRKLFKRRGRAAHPVDSANKSREDSPSRSVEDVSIPRHRRYTVDYAGNETRACASHTSTENSWRESKTLTLKGTGDSNRNMTSSWDVADHVKQRRSLAMTTAASRSSLAIGTKLYSEEVAKRNVQADRAANRAAEPPPTSSSTQSSDDDRLRRLAAHPHSSGSYYLNNWGVIYCHD